MLKSRHTAATGPTKGGIMSEEKKTSENDKATTKALYTKENDSGLNDIGRRIREMRESRGWTQQELADQIPIVRSSLTKWENGYRDFKSEQIVRIADIFGVSCDYVLCGIQPEDSNIHRDLGLSGKAIERLKSWVGRTTAELQEKHGGKMAVYRPLNAIISDILSHDRLEDFIRYADLYAQHEAIKNVPYQSDDPDAWATYNAFHPSQIEFGLYMTFIGWNDYLSKEVKYLAMLYRQEAADILKEILSDLPPIYEEVMGYILSRDIEFVGRMFDEDPWAGDYPGGAVHNPSFTVHKK
jgi:transcriptional regulator with XRE-family HTH domain